MAMCIIAEGPRLKPQRICVSVFFEAKASPPDESGGSHLNTFERPRDAGAPTGTPLSAARMRALPSEHL
jgi:hypothetical protein